MYINKLMYLLLVLIVFSNCSISSSIKKNNRSGVLKFSFIDSLYMNGHVLHASENDKSKNEIKNAISRLETDISKSKLTVDKFYASVAIMKLYFYLKDYEKIDSLEQLLLKYKIDSSYIYQLKGLILEQDGKPDSARLYYEKAIRSNKDGSKAEMIELNFLYDNDFEKYVNSVIELGAQKDFIEEYKKSYELNETQFRAEFVIDLFMYSHFFNL